MNTFNSRIGFQIIINIHNIPETNQIKTAFSRSKLRIASQKSICLELHAIITIKAYPAVPLGPKGGRLIICETMFYNVVIAIARFNTYICLYGIYGSTNNITRWQYQLQCIYMTL